MGLSACSQEASTKKINKYIAAIKKEISNKKPRKSVPALDLTSPIAIKYQAKPLKGPFATREATPVKKGKNFTGNPLLNYPVTMLKFMGTLFMNGRSFAYVMTPDNKLFRVSNGDFIGDRHGKVLSISYNELVIMEPPLNVGTLPAQHKVILKLKEESE